MLQRWLVECTAFDLTNILIDATVPNDTENILNVIVTQIDKKADVATQLEEVILERSFYFQRLEMLYQLCRGLLSEST
jgi:hypothetical protein